MPRKLVNKGQSEKQTAHPQNINTNIPENISQNFSLNPILTQQLLKKSDPKYVRAVADDLTRWGNVADAITLEEFYHKLDVCDHTVENWAKKYKFLEEALHKTLRIIGVRREKGLIYNKFNNYIASTLHHYLRRCENSNKFHADIRAKALVNQISKEEYAEIVAKILEKPAKKETNGST